MKTNNQTSILDKKYSFVKEWKPYDKVYSKVKNAILRHFMNREYLFQSTHEASSKKPFNVYSFSQIENTLGLAYTSSSSYAGLWVCNGGYLWANQTHYFNCFAVSEEGYIIAIAYAPIIIASEANDSNEHEIYINLGKL